MADSGLYTSFVDLFRAPGYADRGVALNRLINYM